MFRLNVELVQPTQLFIDARKLSRVSSLLDSRRPDLLPPVPIRKLGETTVFTDGHTRAFAAYLRGIRQIPVVWDDDDIDLEAYEACVDWCRDEGVLSVADLRDRVVAPEAFESLWLKRCHDMQEELEQRRFAEAPPPGYLDLHLFH